MPHFWTKADRYLGFHGLGVGLRTLQTCTEERVNESPTIAI